MQCRICQSNDGQLLAIPEMMLGLLEKFEYFQCKNCGCIQISQLPVNLADYYPTDYYSFTPPKLSWRGILRCQYLRSLIILRLNGYSLLYQLMKKVYSHDLLEWLTIPRVKFTDKILDVGCGAGHLLVELVAIGYKNLLGIDPYLANDITLNQSVRLRKLSLSELNDQFDFIMLHHSLEHMPDQHEVLEKVKQLLKPTGCILIRIPIVAEAFKRFGTNWVQLDAPRHLFIHTERSFRLLADKHGLVIERVVYDSTAFQFWASEQYQRGIPLLAANSQLHQIHSLKFKLALRKKYGKLVYELNRQGQGDQAAFYLRKK